jgi:hypothetical protein
MATAQKAAGMIFLIIQNAAKRIIYILMENGCKNPDFIIKPCLLLIALIVIKNITITIEITTGGLYAIASAIFPCINALIPLDVPHSGQ